MCWCKDGGDEIGSGEVEADVVDASFCLFPGRQDDHEICVTVALSMGARSESTSIWHLHVGSLHLGDAKPGRADLLANDVERK